MIVLREVTVPHHKPYFLQLVLQKITAQTSQWRLIMYPLLQPIAWTLEWQTFYDCPAGYYCPTAGLSAALACDAGNYSLASAASQTYCPGSTSSTTASSSCFTCAGGTYCPYHGKSNYVNSYTGYYAARASKIETANLPGFYSPSGSNVTKACPPGTYTDSSASSTSTSCTRNTHAGSYASTYCKNCAKGYQSWTGYFKCYLPPIGQPTGQKTWQITRRTGQNTE